MRTSGDVHGCLRPVHSDGYVSGHFKRKDRHISKHFFEIGSSKKVFVSVKITFSRILKRGSKYLG
jgi:hypothetical protein